VTTQNNRCKTHTFKSTNIVDSRIDGMITRRKRKCKKCGTMFYTEEHLVAEHQNPWAKRLPTHSKHKAIINAKPKRRRPYSSRDLDQLTDEELETALMEGNIIFDDDEL